MTCPHCKAEVDNVNKFCGNCGMNLSNADHGFDNSLHFAAAGTFSDQELKVLLEINRKSVSGDEKATVNQSDIDKLFE